MKKNIFSIMALLMLGLLQVTQAQNTVFADDAHSYTLPTFTKNIQGEPVLYWTEKDANNVLALYFSVSKDGGKTFGDKKLIYADAGLGSSRLMRPKLLFKKDGTMAAVFSYRAPAVTPPAPTAHEGGHGNHATATPAPKPKRELQVRYAVSKDKGNSWSVPISVDSDTSRLVRGFFDAVVLANDEIAVAYLKDVKGSTKHEERDLRMVITRNGVFQPEKLIDPVVCDCCNISLLVDNSGKLNIFYRDNNDDVRDIARMTSSDNGGSFSNPQILHHDKWEIKGCPHAGVSSVATANGSLVTWFSGANEQSGVRLVDAEGKLLKVLSANAKNGQVAADDKQGIFVWEQTTEGGASQIFYNKIAGGKVSDNQLLNGSDYGQNATSLLINGKLLVAYEVAKPNAKTGLSVRVVE
ncbi:sialidase family protein [Emticicia agri]|uniref:Exo-alpha-sialidase n=1 Tax=Emticicia agri TaxID=2492393 RepID=A0A4V1ZCG7_9BACT|nr:sialidase family protein [Emticicia agri]RYU92600.1 exo-alpha-sialidase [Emticicia agri]